ncbi:MAG: hypothetical protein ACO3FE_17515 [Planctomycetaceae bacterium]
MKLYWRVKINGKWTWRPAEYTESGPYLMVKPKLVHNQGEEE